MGLMGFEFVKSASPSPDRLEPMFETLGFTLVARHRSKDVSLQHPGMQARGLESSAPERTRLMKRRPT